MLLPQVPTVGLAKPVVVQTKPAPVTVAVIESAAVADPFAAFRLPTNRYPAFVPAVFTEVEATSAGGTVTLSATGGTGLPVAGRVAVTASATVTDSGAAALAAVNALATTVASLKTLITTLTNLVLKIQKKVKA